MEEWFIQFGEKNEFRGVSYRVKGNRENGEKRDPDTQKKINTSAKRDHGLRSTGSKFVVVAKKERNRLQTQNQLKTKLCIYKMCDNKFYNVSVHLSETIRIFRSRTTTWCPVSQPSTLPGCRQALFLLFNWSCRHYGWMPGTVYMTGFHYWFIYDASSQGESTGALLYQQHAIFFLILFIRLLQLAYYNPFLLLFVFYFLFPFKNLLFTSHPAKGKKKSSLALLTSHRLAEETKG